MTKSNGFTLVEVLIASVILMAVLSLTANSFSQSRINSQQAENVVLLHAPLPFILDTIRQQIRDNPIAELHGDGAFQQVEFRWSATTEHFLPPPNSMIVENLQTVTYQPRFRLYNVNLQLRYLSKTREFNFKEIAWLKMAVPQDE
ncbi:MAG: prepilin-type N-terminal cleavage/methylation domain-containing protein [Gammaproteobacteria bacterium]|nr:prepilin-type N-terminal cleavage/methylation domain-containing protein [Gammaproteobacteria bacterium]